MRPLFDGTSGQIGFAQHWTCYTDACYNEEGSDPENLGNDIINFIVSHTAQELEEFKIMVGKNIEDSEISLRYLPRRPYFHHTDDHLKWIPEYEEMGQPVDQRYLLDKIWNGCQRHLIDDHYDHEIPNWTYRIDLENRTLKMTGVFEHKSMFSFDELQKGMFDGWRKQNDPSESWVTESESDVGERMSARKGLAACKVLKAGDQDEREGKRRRLNIEYEEKKESGANSRTKAWLAVIWEKVPDEDSEQLGQATTV